MIKKYLIGLSLIFGMTLFIYLTDKPKENNLTSPTQEKEYTVRLTGQKWVTVLNAVSTMPLKDVQGLYMEIVTQIQMQDSVKKK